jgi:hypothetical protein
MSVGTRGDIIDPLRVGRIRIERVPGVDVRVPDHVLDCVGYVAQYVTSDFTGDDYDLEGSGFFVGVPCVTVPGQRFFYFVTAAHVISDLDPERTRIIVNHKNGSKTTIQMTEWFFHEDKTVDAAVMPHIMRAAFSARHMNIDTFLTHDKMNQRLIGIGDDVFFPGLFSFVPGKKQNRPILRHGNIAMLPDEEIQVDGGFARVHLIEARSIGGISGSPVFVRETVSLPALRADGSETLIIGNGNDFHLLGMIRTHWDVKESDLNSYSAIQDKQRGVNMGFAVVTPAAKILEVLNLPVLVERRAEAERKYVADTSPRG